MANGCAVQKNAFYAASDRQVVCPKPRRLFPAVAVAVCPFRWTSAQPAEDSDPKHAMDLQDLDFFLPKMDPTPPFFCGSPPTRSGNPVVHDARFGEAPPLCPVPASPSWAGSGSSARSDYSRIRYGVVPAAVRIEGFDCLDRERSGSRGIPAFA